MYERFTDRARKVMQLANQEAHRFGQQHVGTEHILLGLVKEGAGVAANVLKAVDIDLRKVRIEVEQLITPATASTSDGRLAHTPGAKQVVGYSVEEAHSLGHNYVGTEHLLLGLLREEDGVAAQVLVNLGVKLDAVRGEVLAMLGHDPAGDRTTATSRPKLVTPVLTGVGRDLTDLARRGQLDPVVGRDGEIDRVIQVLGRRSRNNPLLVGESGVGKASVVHGLAQRIAAAPDRPDLPRVPWQCRVIAVDVRELVGGLDWSAVEKRVTDLFAEVHQAGDVVLFVDGLHALVGGGPAGLLDVSNLLVPALARGQLQIIGTTTAEAYRTVVMRDAGIARRFEEVVVDPPDMEQAVAMLMAVRGRYEAHHRVRVTDAAVHAAVDLSDRHLPGRVLPGKAVDVLDEACSRAVLLAVRSAVPPAEAAVDGRVVAEVVAQMAGRPLDGDEPTAVVGG